MKRGPAPVATIPVGLASKLLLAGLSVATRLAAGEAFVDVSASRGLSFDSANGASGKKFLVETMVGGVAWLDYDRDGFLDLYLVQGHERPEAALNGPGPAGGPANKLFRNRDGARFEDVTGTTRVGDRGYGMGAAVGDFDADGFQDLYVTNYGANSLYRNRGDGSFEDVTRAAGVAAPGWSTSASWADFNGDGLLDLYVVNYLAYDTRRDGACPAQVPRSSRPVASYCHPMYFDGVADVLYMNNGDGTFRDASREAGIALSKGRQEAKGLGVVASDFDADGDVDILVANDSVANTLWKNLGRGRFENVALEVGFALNADGAAEAGMGICRGDVDGDGRLDYFVTNFSRETNTLYVHQGRFFHDATVARGLARPAYLQLGFGACFLDHDVDGDLDLYVANGHVQDNVETLHPGERIGYAQPDQLLENDGRGHFRDVSARSGRWFQRSLVGRGAALADYDNDGDPDLVVTNVAGPAVLLENRARAAAWIGLELSAAAGAGTVHNALVEMEHDGRRRIGEVQTDGSYLSAHDPRLRFALAGNARRVTVKVRWPGRKTPEVFAGLEPGRYHVLSRKSP